MFEEFANQICVESPKRIRNVEKTAKQIKRWIDKVGLNSVLTFGATPQKIDEPAKTWCHTEELKEDNSGILYYGISIQWKEILEYIAYKTRNG